MNHTDPTDLTIDTYNTHFDRYVERTTQHIDGDFKEWLDLFLSHLQKPARIFELGSAMGRDARYFRSNGASVFCTDVIPIALERLSQDGFETSLYDFRDDPLPEWKGAFEGAFANAVLLHADPDSFVQALNHLASVLIPNGICAFSVKAGIGEEVSHDKMEAPRYFHYYDKSELQEVLASLPYKLLYIDYAENNKWLHVIFRT